MLHNINLNKLIIVYFDTNNLVLIFLRKKSIAKYFIKLYKNSTNRICSCLLQQDSDHDQGEWAIYFAMFVVKNLCMAITDISAFNDSVSMSDNVQHYVNLQNTFAIFKLVLISVYATVMKMSNIV